MDFRIVRDAELVNPSVPAPRQITTLLTLFSRVVVRMKSNSDAMDAWLPRINAEMTIVAMIPFLRFISAQGLTYQLLTRASIGDFDRL